MATFTTATATDSAPTPEFINFPPFYTLQPNEKTRSQQLLLWRNLILDWVKGMGSASIQLNSFELFENRTIGRKLSPEGVAAVAKDLVTSGHAVWEDLPHSSLRVTWRTATEWASILHSWATENQFIGGMYTLYELHSGDISRGSEVYGMESAVLMEALDILQQAGKVQLFVSDTPDETGIKFLA